MSIEASPEYLEGYRVGQAYRRGDETKHSVTCPYRYLDGQAREWYHWRLGWTAGKKAKVTEAAAVLRK